MSGKIKKVRTSITIDPAVLNAARAEVEHPDSPFKSVAAFIEAALGEYLGADKVLAQRIAAEPQVV